jgi:hypothetical protein
LGRLAAIVPGLGVFGAAASYVGEMWKIAQHRVHNRLELQPRRINYRHIVRQKHSNIWRHRTNHEPAGSHGLNGRNSIRTCADLVNHNVGLPHETPKF